MRHYTQQIAVILFVLGILINALPTCLAVQSHALDPIALSQLKLQGVSVGEVLKLLEGLRDAQQLSLTSLESSKENEKVMLEQTLARALEMFEGQAKICDSRRARANRLHQIVEQTENATNEAEERIKLDYVQISAMKSARCVGSSFFINNLKSLRGTLKVLSTITKLLTGKPESSKPKPPTGNNTKPATNATQPNANATTNATNTTTKPSAPTAPNAPAKPENAANTTAPVAPSAPAKPGATNTSSNGTSTPSSNSGSDLMGFVDLTTTFTSPLQGHREHIEFLQLSYLSDEPNPTTNSSNDTTGKSETSSGSSEKKDSAEKSADKKSFAFNVTKTAKAEQVAKSIQNTEKRIKTVIDFMESQMMLVADSFIEYKVVAEGEIEQLNKEIKVANDLLDDVFPREALADLEVEECDKVLKEFQGAVTRANATLNASISSYDSRIWNVRQQVETFNDLMELYQTQVAGQLDNLGGQHDSKVVGYAADWSTKTLEAKNNLRASSNP